MARLDGIWYNGSDYFMIIDTLVGWPVLYDALGLYLVFVVGIGRECMVCYVISYQI